MAKTDNEAKQYEDAWGEEALPQEAPAQDPAADAEGGPGLAVVIAAAPEGEDVSADTQAEAVEEAAEGETVAEQAAEGEPGEAAEELTPEELQRQKSWEGRLRKREEELAAKVAALEAAPASEAAATAPDDIAAIEARFGEDFGPDFIGDLKALIQHYAGSAAGELGKGFDAKLQELAGGIQSALQSMHESAILDAHPDLDDVVGSESFKQWLASKDEDKRATAVNVLTKGMWPQIIRLVATYKDETKAGAVAEEDPFANAPAAAASEAPDPFEDSAIAAPASVAIRMPGKPGSEKDEFDAAWEE